MKPNKIIFFLALCLFSCTSKAQIFESLFNKAKSALNNILEENANKFLDNGIEMIEKNAGKLVELTSKTKNKSSQKSSNNHTSFIESSKPIVASNEIEEMLSKEYPRFYSVYQEVLNDPLVEKISFIARDKHDEVCSFKKPGTLIFDIHFFEDLKNKKGTEPKKVWILLVNQGLIHYNKDHSNSNRSDMFDFAFNFALQESKRLAQNGNCAGLNFAINSWQFNSFPNKTYRREARDRIIQKESFKTFTNTFKEKCN